VVLIQEESPRMKWKLGVIEGLVKGRDNLIRSAKVRTRNGITRRPIVRLYPLEINERDGVN
jgi:hypothetical protein